MWQSQALCGDLDGRDGDDFLTLPIPEQRRICAACPVTAACLAYALAEESQMAASHQRQLGTVYGGLTSRQRIPLVTERTPKQRPLPDCGTRAGYQAHRSRQEDACTACKYAAALSMRKWRPARAPQTRAGAAAASSTTGDTSRSSTRSPNPS